MYGIPQPHPFVGKMPIPPLFFLSILPSMRLRWSSFDHLTHFSSSPPNIWKEHVSPNIPHRRMEISNKVTQGPSLLTSSEYKKTSSLLVTTMQGCRNCCILPSRIGEHGVSLENMGNIGNMENMENMENINQMTQKSPEDFRRRKASLLLLMFK